MNFDNWYKNKIEFNQENVPEIIWNDISLELDIDDTWRNISKDLTFKSRVRFFKNCAIVLLTLFISGTIYFNLKSTTGSASVCENIQIDEQSLYRLPADYLFSLYYSNIKQVNSMHKNIINNTINIKQNHSINQTGDEEILSYKVQPEFDMLKRLNHITVYNKNQQEKIESIIYKEPVIDYSRFSASIFDFSIPDSLDPKEYARFTGRLADMIKLPRGFFFGLLSSNRNMVSSSTNFDIPQSYGNNTLYKNIGFTVGYNYRDKFEFSIEGNFGSDYNQQFFELKNGLKNNVNVHVSYQYFYLITKFKHPFIFLNKIPSSGNIVIGTGTGFTNNSIELINQSSGISLKETKSYNIYFIAGYDYDFYFYKNWGLTIGARTTYGINNLGMSNDLPNSIQNTRTLEFNIVAGIKFTPNW